jgi:uncharacterized membrane protein YdbT with pleckstrin-like domain
MPDIVIHPTRRWISLGYTAVFIVCVAAVFLHTNYLRKSGWPDWWLLIPAALFLWPFARGLRRRFTKITISADRLRYETGILSKTTRTIPLANVQDVRVDQTLFQRLFSIGNLSVETAGETSQLKLPNIDSPQEVADEIMDTAQGKTPKKKGEGE